MLQNFTKSRIKPVHIRKSTTTCQKLFYYLLRIILWVKIKSVRKSPIKIDLSHIFAKENVYLKLELSKNDRVDENVFNFSRIFATQCFIE